MSKNSIPPKNRPEWRKMVRGEIEHNFKNYVLQIHLHQLTQDIESGRISEENAIEQIYNLCKKYKLVVKDDFTQIFKTW